MLTIFNNLEPFFKDNYKRINVREYARIKKISPPSASTLLSKLNKEKLLNKEKEKNYIYYSANNENKQFIELSRIYWSQKFKNLTEFIKNELISPTIILFGSFSKAEINVNSDIDLAIFSSSKTKINLEIFEKKFKREIQIFKFKNKKEVKNKNLLNNILNGFILEGRL
jgi:predicted nucleotidyltransferase